ncbi:MAG: PAS domain S-box protein [Pseudomonadota bacterium]
MPTGAFTNINIDDLASRLDEILVRELPDVFTIDPSEDDRLASIVSSSDEIIISKTLDGIVTSWNASATRILGFQESEMIGKPILEIIPPELHSEETEIMAAVLRGERVEAFDTERLCKDGSRVSLEVTVSPLRDHLGRIFGASKIARVVTNRKRVDELHKLLFKDLDHRVKNTLMIMQSLANLSIRTSPSIKEFAESINGQVTALARAHDLLVNLLVDDNATDVRLVDLVSEQVNEDQRIDFSGPDISLKPDAAVEVALYLHGLAAHARKAGALLSPTGTLAITWRADCPREEIVIDWREDGGGDPDFSPDDDVGHTLIKSALKRRGGTVTEMVGLTGFCCELRLPFENGKMKGEGALWH